MTTAALICRTLLRPDARAVSRGVIAGIAWGLLLAAGLTALEAWRCGVICLDSFASNALLSAAIGIVSIGPLAALGRKASPPEAKPENQTMPLRRLTALAFAVTLAAAAGALTTDARAQTAEQQAACQGDAQTYCSAYIPDHELIRRCLVRNRGRISAACRGVLYGGQKRRARYR